MDPGLVRSLFRWRNRQRGSLATITDDELLLIADREPTHIGHLRGLDLRPELKNGMGKALVERIRQHYMEELYVELELDMERTPRDGGAL